MQRICWLAACLLFPSTIAQTVTAQTCYQTDDQIKSSFASYSEVVINCLSVTPSGSVGVVILSAFNSSNNETGASFVATCGNDTLNFYPSSFAADFSSADTAGCSTTCVDADQPCNDRKFLI